MSEKNEYLVHRVRNQATEKDLPEGKLCGDLLRGNEHGSIINQDVNCAVCLIEMIKRKIIEIKDPKESIVIKALYTKNDIESISNLVFESQNQGCVTISFGEQDWFIVEMQQVEKLRDYLDNILKDQRSDLPAKPKRKTQTESIIEALDMEDDPDL